MSVRADDYQSDPLIPPPELLFDGTTTAESFVLHGEGFVLETLIRRARLAPHERVLDLGCGNGQKARVLTRYLTSGGSYEGIDIVRAGIDWCRKAYASYPNFRFNVAEGVFNSHYNPTGSLRANSYRLPFRDADFDLVFLVSVFTHLMADGVKNYVAEIARVLKPQGRCVATAFLVNDATREAAARGSNGMSFVSDDQGVHLFRDAKNPAMGVALDEMFMRRAFANNGLSICEISYGYWSGAPDLLHAQQDCVIAIKR